MSGPHSPHTNLNGSSRQIGKGAVAFAIARWVLVAAILIGCGALISLHTHGGYSWAPFLVILWVVGLPLALIVAIRRWVKYRVVHPLPRPIGKGEPRIIWPHKGGRRVRVATLQVIVCLGFGLTAALATNNMLAAGVFIAITYLGSFALGMIYLNNTRYARFFDEEVWIRDIRDKVVLRGVEIDNVIQMSTERRQFPVLTLQSGASLPLPWMWSNSKSTTSIFRDDAAAQFEREIRSLRARCRSDG